MNRISYSQYSKWASCPYSWKLKYIDDLSEFEHNIYLIFGSATHTVIQKYLEVMYSESIRKADELNLSEMLQGELINEFKKAEKSDNKAPCTKKELYDFFDDGIKILDYFKKHRGEYFPKQGWELLGCEIPLSVDLERKITFVGYIDVAIKHKPTNRVKIIDIKTSTMGWNKYQKKDKVKTSQLLLYKHFFAKQQNHPIENIDVEYFIVKRKLWENAAFPQKQIQTFSPANGKVSINKVTKELDNFINTSFDENGNYISEQNATPSKKNCKWCEFRKTKYCKLGV